MIKAVFFDVDGTLLPFGTGKVPESTIKSIEKLKENGIKVFVATGKSLALMLNTDVKRIPFDGYLTLNGQIAYNEKLSMLHGIPIIQEEMEILSQIFKADKIPFEMIGEFSRYINFVDDRVITNVNNTNSIVPNIDKYKGEKIYQITAYTDKRIIDVLKNTLDFCKVTFWAEEACDIVSKHGGKEVGIKSLLDDMGILPEETMAFGDSQNDNGMLQMVGVGVAMGNALDITKEVADYITDDINNDGIEKALKHYNLI